MDDNFYKQLTEDEKQLCDLCRDWNLGECEKCEFVSNIKKGEKIMNVILYTIDCPKCIVLEKKLNSKSISFIRVSDKKTLVAKRFGDAHFPILEVDGVVMDYKTAIQWINNQ